MGRAPMVFRCRHKKKQASPPVKSYKRKIKTHDNAKNCICYKNKRPKGSRFTKVESGNRTQNEKPYNTSNHRKKHLKPPLKYGYNQFETKLCKYANRF